MHQTRQASLIESVTNVAIGYLVSVTAQIVFFPLVGVQANWSQNLSIGLAFTIFSLIRIYLVRRRFNRNPISLTKKGSALEAIVNVAIGYGISFIGQIVVFPLLGVRATLTQNLLLGVGFTIVSLGRSYLLRRLFIYVQQYRSISRPKKAA